MMGMVGVGPIGVAGAAPATPISFAKGMKVDFELDDTFVDVDTLLGMEDADMLLGSYYSPFRNANAGGVPQPMGAAPTSALERMVTTIAPALHSIAASGGLQQQQHMQPHVVARSHLSPSAARIAHSPLSATPGSAVRRSFRLTPQKHVYNHPSRSPYRARGLNVNGVGDAAHAAAAPPGAVAVAGAGAGAVMDSSYVFKSPTLELGNTYDAMSLGIGDGSFLVGNPNTQPSSSRGLVGAQSTHVYQKQRSSSSGAGKSSSRKKKQTGSGGGGGSGPTKAAMPKRGEYKCGKCGYFPKKTKHNCDNERVKRTAAGLPTGKGPAGSSKMPLSAEMMQAKEYQYGAPIKIKFGDGEPY